MFGKLKNFAARKLMERQLKDMPKDQQEMIMAMFEKDPKLFEDIAKDIQAEVKKGSSQMQAAMKVMPKYQSKMQALAGGMQAPHGRGFNPNGTIRR